MPHDAPPVRVSVPMVALAVLGALLLPTVVIGRRLAPVSTKHIDAGAHVATSPWRAPLAFNPLSAGAFPHADVFTRFAPAWRGAFDASALRDFLGVRTDYDFDCTDDYGYLSFVPSRALPCRVHAARRNASGPTVHGAVVDGDLPLVDDEYPEWVEVLEAVVRTADTLAAQGGRRQRGSGGEPAFVVAELGARFGTWGVRALAAWARVAPPDARAKYIAV